MVDPDISRRAPSFRSSRPSVDRLPLGHLVTSRLDTEEGGVPLPDPHGMWWALRMRRGSGADRGRDRHAPPDVPVRSGDASASVLIGGERFVASPDQPLVFGRDDGNGVVGLHADDMGLSAVAGSLELAWGVWWVINQSTKRPLLLEHPGGTTQMRLAPGHRHALTTDRVDILVPGAIYTHVLEVALPEAYVAGLRGGGGTLTTGTLTGEVVDLSDRERDALTGMCAGYLASFPHRREHPNTYEEAARLLGGEPWTADKVRKAVERVKDRFARKQQIYFQGPQGNYDLAVSLVASGVLSGEDLARLHGRRRS